MFASHSHRRFALRFTALPLPNKHSFHTQRCLYAHMLHFVLVVIPSDRIASCPFSLRSGQSAPISTKPVTPRPPHTQKAPITHNFGTLGNLLQPLLADVASIFTGMAAIHPIRCTIGPKCSRQDREHHFLLLLLLPTSSFIASIDINQLFTLVQGINLCAGRKNIPRSSKPQRVPAT